MDTNDIMVRGCELIPRAAVGLLRDVDKKYGGKACVQLVATTLQTVDTMTYELWIDGVSKGIDVILKADGTFVVKADVAVSA